MSSQWKVGGNLEMKTNFHLRIPKLNLIRNKIKGLINKRADLTTIKDFAANT